MTTALTIWLNLVLLGAFLLMAVPFAAALWGDIMNTGGRDR